ncbi:MAG: hypothetical protein DCC75_02660 [Proteobacteria bacterium]|nr:MAG: hypothetical protein DCC75_02660 [Pseudomonadota bacterium]
MADSTGNIGSASLQSLIDQLNPASGADAKKDKGVIGKDEFLKMLVTQLKNQDPLDPMKGDEFAVNLAQFSQLEQLININDKLEGSDSSSNDMSLASYLGQVVTTNSDQVTVNADYGGLVNVNLKQDVAQLTIELVDSSGAVRKSINLGAAQAGRRFAELADLNLANGIYQVRVKAIGTTGESFEPKGYSAGMVTGFVPGPDPLLLLGEREVKTSEIKEVSLASA